MCFSRNEDYRTPSLCPNAPRLSTRKILIPRAPVPRYITNIIILQHSQHLLWQRPYDFDRIHPWQIGAKALPFGDPGCGRVADGNEGIEDGRGAFCDGVGGVGELQEGLAVGAAGADEFLKGVK